LDGGEGNEGGQGFGKVLEVPGGDERHSLPAAHRLPVALPPPDSFPPRSCAVARRVSLQGSAAPAAPTPIPADRSDTLPPPADRSGDAPPSTQPFAITVIPITVHHAIHRDATPFWVWF
jgi:hypothetical protein